MAEGDTPDQGSCAWYLRLCVAFTGAVLLFSGVGMQIFSAGNLYGVPLSLLCQAYTGTPDFSTTASFQTLISTALANRAACLALNGSSRDACCAQIGGYTGLCAQPSNLGGIIPFSNGTYASAHYKMNLMTTILGEFFNVPSPNMYIDANPEFWCRNCPNDFRQKCPFVPVDSGKSAFSSSSVCACPGGTVSQPGQAFWSTIGEDLLSTDFILCDDKAQVPSSTFPPDPSFHHAC